MSGGVRNLRHPERGGNSGGNLFRTPAITNEPVDMRLELEAPDEAAALAAIALRSTRPVELGPGVPMESDGLDRRSLSEARAGAAGNLWGRLIPPGRSREIGSPQGEYGFPPTSLSATHRVVEGHGVSRLECAAGLGRDPRGAQPPGAAAPASCVRWPWLENGLA